MHKNAAERSHNHTLHNYHRRAVILYYQTAKYKTHDWLTSDYYKYLPPLCAPISCRLSSCCKYFANNSLHRLTDNQIYAVPAAIWSNFQHWPHHKLQYGTHNLFAMQIIIINSISFVKNIYILHINFQFYLSEFACHTYMCV